MMAFLGSKLAPFVVGVSGYIVAGIIFLVYKYRVEYLKIINNSLQKKLDQVTKAYEADQEYRARKIVLDRKLEKEMNKNAQSIEKSKKDDSLDATFSRINELFDSATED